MSYNFNFDDDDDDFDMEEINRIIRHLQQSIFKQLKQQGLDPEKFNLANIDISNFKGMDISDLQEMISQAQSDPNTRRIGFSVHMGPDGQPHIQPINPNEMMSGMNSQQQKRGGFEEPFVDVFFSDESGQYQIIAEVQGVTHPDMIHLKVEESELQIHAEQGPYKYKKTLQLQQPMDSESLEYTLTNGVLEITAQAE